MPNKNYIAGRRKEYKECNKLKLQGFDIVQRTAGSHSPIDIIAINKTKKEIVFVQCKPDSMNETQRQHIRDDNKELNGLYNIKFSIR
jgi:Holliday junction resolvase-like predicted endonuclease